MMQADKPTETKSVCVICGKTFSYVRNFSPMAGRTNKRKTCGEEHRKEYNRRQSRKRSSGNYQTQSSLAWGSQL